MLSWFSEILSKFGQTLMSILPVSPFDKYIGSFSDLPFLGYLNWFIPIKSIIIVGLSWLSIITLFYIYSIIMRWVKMLGD